MSGPAIKIKKILQRICHRCVKANGGCIKNEIAYIGLCCKRDRAELIKYIKRKRGC